MEKSFLLNVFDNNYVLLYRKVELRKKTNRKANMTKRQTYIIALAITCCILVAIGMTLHFGRKASTPPAPTPKPNIVAKEKPQPKDTIKKVKPVVRKTDYTISGTLTDEEGNGVADVIVSDGYTCVKTDSTGRYKMKRDSLARFIYYSVPRFPPILIPTARLASIRLSKLKRRYTTLRLPACLMARRGSIR